MKWKFWVFLLLVAIIRCQSVTASLTLVQYEPFVFKLKFSQAVPKPDFQLLLNNLYPINYSFLTADQLSDTYFFQADGFQVPQEEILEDYKIIFNSPMKIGGGRLSVEYFMLTADKVIIQIDYSQTLGLLAVLAAYIMINFTVLGLALMEFLQVYCLIMFRNEAKTMLYHQISKDLLLLNPILTDGTYSSNGALSAIILAPLIIILLVGTIGFLVKHCVKKTKSIIQRILYETFVYNVFVTVSTVFMLPLFYNSIQFYQLCKVGTIDPSSTIAKWGSFTSYLSIVATVAILYLFTYAINPKYNETGASWKKYLKTEQYHSFRKLHEMLIWQPWYKRNQNIFTIIKRLAIGGLFFWVDGFEVVVFLLQFGNIFYIFTFRPFKYEIYMNTSVITRLLMFMFYGFILLGNLYYDLGTITINYQNVKKFLNARDAIFLVIILSIFLFIFYEIYNKCSNLNYQIKVVREQNEFRLKITERQKLDVDDVGRRNHGKSFGDSDQHSFSRNARFTTFENSTTPRKAREGSLQKHVSFNSRASRRQKDKEQEMKSSLPIKLEVNSINDRDRADSYVTSEGKKKEKRGRHKWKKQSLLAEILKDN